MTDLYTARAILKLVKFLATAVVLSVSTVLLAKLIGIEAVGTLFSVGVAAYLAYHFVVTDADIERRMDELNAKYNKKD